MLTALTDLIIKYLVCQYDAGASLLQVFDTNGGELPPALYAKLCVPDLLRIADEVKRQRPEAVLVVFPKDVVDLEIFESSKYDVVGVSWKDDPVRVRKLWPGSF